MARLLLTAIVACTLVALSSATRFRARNFVHYQEGSPNYVNSPLDASAYFFKFLSPYFPNEKLPGARLIQAEYVGADTNGAPSTPIKFFVIANLQDSLHLYRCRLIVHLGNQVTGDLSTLYYGEDLSDCSY